MLTVPQQQALQRWDTLPEEIREALVSEQSVAVLEKIAKDEHIPEEKITTISRVAGYVLMGFLHIEDTAQELKEALGIDPRIAESIAKTLNSKIFSAFKNQIEKLYQPVGKEEMGSLASQEMAFQKAKERPLPPKPMESIGAPTMPTPPGGGQPRPKMISEMGQVTPVGLGTGRMVARETPPPKFQPPSTPQATPPKPPINKITPPVPQRGWGGERGKDAFGIVEEIKKLERSGAELIDVLKRKEEKIETQPRGGGSAMEASKKAALPITTGLTQPQTTLPSGPATISPASGPFDRFDKLTASKPGAGPVILHRETGVAPVRPPTSFKLELPSQRTGAPSAGSYGESKMARVETGNQPKNQWPTQAQTEVFKAPKVVHYNSFQTPVEKPPMPQVAPSSVASTPGARPPVAIGGDQPTKPPQVREGFKPPATVNYSSGGENLGGAPTLKTPQEESGKSSGGWFGRLFKKSESENKMSGRLSMGSLPPTPPPPAPRPKAAMAPAAARPQEFKPATPGVPQPQKTVDLRGMGEKDLKKPGEEMIDLDNMEIKK